MDLIKGKLDDVNITYTFSNLGDFGGVTGIENVKTSSLSFDDVKLFSFTTDVFLSSKLSRLLLSRLFDVISGSRIYRSSDDISVM